MKLLLCCENYPPSVGGVQEVMRQIAERLAARGHDVTVATGAHSGRAEDSVRNGVRVRSFAVSGGLVQGMRGDVDAYRRFVIDGGFDAVLIKAAQQWSFDALTSVLPEIKSRKVFIPCGFSGLYENRFRNYFVEMPGWLSRFDALIFYANDYRDISFARKHGIKNIVILPNGADEREFSDVSAPGFRQKLGVGDDALLLLTVGTINGAKGHWEVARAFELAKLGRPATLILNGERLQRSGFRAAAQLLRDLARLRLPLDALVKRINRRGKEIKRVIVCNLSRHDLVSAFKASDLFVFASHVEYSPLVLFEAAAAGTPFLTVPAGNAAEIVRWTQGGEVCDASAEASGRLRPDPVRLAASMEALLSDPERMAQLGQNGRKAFMEGLSWDSIVARYEAVLDGGEAWRTSPALKNLAPDIQVLN